MTKKKCEIGPMAVPILDCDPTFVELVHAYNEAQSFGRIPSMLPIKEIKRQDRRIRDERIAQDKKDREIVSKAVLDKQKRDEFHSNARNKREELDKTLARLQEEADESIRNLESEKILEYQRQAEKRTQLDKDVEEFSDANMQEEELFEDTLNGNEEQIEREISQKIDEEKKALKDEMERIEDEKIELEERIDEENKGSIIKKNTDGRPAVYMNSGNVARGITHTDMSVFKGIWDAVLTNNVQHVAGRYHTIRSGCDYTNVDISRSQQSKTVCGISNLHFTNNVGGLTGKSKVLSMKSGSSGYYFITGYIPRGGLPPREFFNLAFEGGRHVIMISEFSVFYIYIEGVSNPESVKILDEINNLIDKPIDDSFIGQAVGTAAGVFRAVNVFAKRSAADLTSGSVNDMLKLLDSSNFLHKINYV